MSLLTCLLTMGKSDLKLIGRDQFLIGLAIYPLVFWVVLRFGLPPGAEWLLESYQLDLRPSFGLLASILVIGVPGFVGMIAGMLLVEEQDDQTLTAILVTPLSLNRYLAYRCAAAAAASFGLGLILIPNLDLIAVPAVPLVLTILTGSLAAPFNALLFFGLARNKIQAFGVLKILGALSVLPFAAWFVPPPAQWLFGLFPPYWPVAAFWRAAAGEAAGWHLLLGVAGFALSFWILSRLAQARIYRGAAA